MCHHFLQAYGVLPDTPLRACGASDSGLTGDALELARQAEIDLRSDMAGGRVVPNINR